MLLGCCLGRRAATSSSSFIITEAKRAFATLTFILKDDATKKLDLATRLKAEGANLSVNLVIDIMQVALEKVKADVKKAEADVKKAEADVKTEKAIIHHLKFKLDQMEAAYLHVQGLLRCRSLIEKMEGRFPEYFKIRLEGGRSAAWSLYAKKHPTSPMINIMMKCLLENGLPATPDVLGITMQGLYSSFSHDIHEPSSEQVGEDYIVYVTRKTTSTEMGFLNAIVKSPGGLHMKRVHLRYPPTANDESDLAEDLADSADSEPEEDS